MARVVRLHASGVHAAPGIAMALEDDEIPPSDSSHRSIVARIVRSKWPSGRGGAGNRRNREIAWWIVEW